MISNQHPIQKYNQIYISSWKIRIHNHHPKSQLKYKLINSKIDHFLHPTNQKKQESILPLKYNKINCLHLIRKSNLFLPS